MVAAKKSVATKKPASKVAKARKGTAKSVSANAKARKAPIVAKASAKTTRFSLFKRAKGGAKKKSDTSMHSFRLAKESTPFMSFCITRQTVYWVVLVAFIIFAQLWILSLQVEVASLLDAQQSQLSSSSF